MTEQDSRQQMEYDRIELSKHPFKCAECKRWFDDGEPESLCEQCEYVESIHVIRAFVERVEQRVTDGHECDSALRDELAAMEGEHGKASEAS